MKSYLTYWYLLSLVLILSSCADTNTITTPKASQQKDSIALWITQAKATVSQEKESLLQKAYRAVTLLPEDTIKAKHLENIANAYFNTTDTLTALKINKETIQLALKIVDSSSLAGAYWDLGYYLSERQHKKDSGFYYYAQAQQLYEGLGNTYYSASMLINMANNQIDIRDYIGGEINTIKAIQLLLPLKEYERLYSCYNNLGITFGELGEYNKALLYHNQALEHLRKTDKRTEWELVTLNNIGIVYKNQKKYREAIKKYKEALHYNALHAKKLIWEAILLDNIAYAKFKLGDTTDLPNLFYKALKVRDSLNFIPGIVVNTLHLAEYYATYKDTVKALDYAHKTRKLAASSHNFKDLLESLILLSRLEQGEQGKTYLYEHIQLSDSLQKEERKLRNKFFRIRFETDQLKREREKLIGQKTIFGNWIVSLSIFIVLISGVTYYYYHRQRLYQLRFKALLSEKETPEQQTIKETPSEQVSDVNISEAALSHIQSQLAVFVSEKQYLNKAVSLNQLAKTMDTNPKYLSHVVNFYERKSFIDYIKDLRIGYVLEVLKSDAVLRKYSIKAIASEVGFNTAEAFSKAFYKKTGLYPSYFIKELEKTLVEQVQVTDF